MPSTPLTGGPLKERIRSVDILRGAVIVLMAIDHVRVYSGLPAGGQTAGIFFTRWITHFCAPAFVFFAGTSAFLYGRKLQDKAALSKYLLTRGLLLVLLELTLIRFSWTFNFDYSEFVLAGVIWMIGWCMALMAALIWLRTATVGIIGLAIIFFQQVFAYVPKIFPASMQASFGKFWEFIYSSGFEGPKGITILYVLVPWIGVMAAGYGFGLIVTMEPARRRKICLAIGLGAIAAFFDSGNYYRFKRGFAGKCAAFYFSFVESEKISRITIIFIDDAGTGDCIGTVCGEGEGMARRCINCFWKGPFLLLPAAHTIDPFKRNCCE